MARITVEDCIDKFPSRFELVLVASNRARKLHSGEEPTVEKDNDKNTVIALREIAQETLTTNQLKNDLIEEYQTVTNSDEEEFDEDTSASEEALIQNDEDTTQAHQDESSKIDDKVIEQNNEYKDEIYSNNEEENDQNDNDNNQVIDN